jgi:hypothetical protein
MSWRVPSDLAVRLRPGMLPQRLKPLFIYTSFGTAEAVPLPKN